MSNDLMVPTVTATYAVSDAAGQQRAAAGEPPAHSSQGPTVSTGPNPSLQLDPALGLVVIQFRDDAGDVTTTIPSQRQIQAYERWQSTHFGPVPPGMHVASTVPAITAMPARAATTTPPPAEAASTKSEDH